MPDDTPNTTGSEVHDLVSAAQQSLGDGQECAHTTDQQACAQSESGAEQNPGCGHTQEGCVSEESKSRADDVDNADQTMGEKKEDCRIPEGVAADKPPQANVREEADKEEELHKAAAKKSALMTTLQTRQGKLAVAAILLCLVGACVMWSVLFGKQEESKASAVKPVVFYKRFPKKKIETKTMPFRAEDVDRQLRISKKKVRQKQMREKQQIVNTLQEMLKKDSPVVAGKDPTPEQTNQPVASQQSSVAQKQKPKRRARRKRRSLRRAEFEKLEVTDVIPPLFPDPAKEKPKYYVPGKGGVQPGGIIVVAKADSQVKADQHQIEIEEGTQIPVKLETGVNTRYRRATVLARVTTRVRAGEGAVAIPRGSVLKGRISQGDGRIYIDFHTVVVEGRKYSFRGHAVSGSLPGIPAKARVNTDSPTRSKASGVLARSGTRTLRNLTSSVLPGGGSLVHELSRDVAREGVGELDREARSRPTRIDLEVPSGTEFKVVVTD